MINKNYFLYIILLVYCNIRNILCAEENTAYEIMRCMHDIIDPEKQNCEEIDGEKRGPCLIELMKCYWDGELKLIPECDYIRNSPF